MDKKKVLEALNLDLEHEMAAMIRYLHHSFIVTGPLRGSLSAVFRAQATDSMAHAIKLGEKIVALGGHPSVKIQEIYEPGEQTIEEMLQEDVNSERMHLELYEEQLEKVMSDNTPLRLMFEQMIADEAQHLEQLEMYLRENTTAGHTVKAKAKV